MKKTVKKFLQKNSVFVVFCVLSIAVFLFPSATQAAVNLGLDVGGKIGLSSTDPRVVVIRIIQIILGFLGLLAISLIIYGGFLWMTSAGSEDRIEKAKQILRNAVIGLLIILSAFGITAFIIAKLLEATGGSTGTTGGGNNSGIGGSGVLGACSVESVYPAPDQKEVARNTSIIITFKEAIDPKTLCNDADDNGCGGEELNSNNAKIYKTKDGEDSFLAGVKVYGTSDKANKTFVLVPAAYLGSPSEYLWYTVHLGKGISKADGNTSIFIDCRADFMDWKFEVSNKIDLTPPQVKESGVFPPPDSARDKFQTISEAAQAKGSFVVKALPQIYSPAKISEVAAQGASPKAEVLADPDCRLSGKLLVAVEQDELTAKLSSADGKVLYGSAVFADKEINFPNFFSLKLSSAGEAVKAGNSWMVTIESMKQADAITVGNEVYVFVAKDKKTALNQIEKGGTINETAENIAAAINPQADVNAAAAAAEVKIISAAAGKAGNDILLAANNSGTFSINLMEGGTDRAENIIVGGGKKDQPMNTVIQINFNEAILPTTVVGLASEVADYIKVVNADPAAKDAGAPCKLSADCKSFKCGESNVCEGATDYLPGKFKIANQYQTVEFISDKQCGVNGCGEPIYCLPENSQLKVVLMAADLATCAGEAECVAKTPYTFCGADKICQDKNDCNKNYPLADVVKLNGLADAALNSFDGDRSNTADGKKKTYDENSGVKPKSSCPADSLGDNFSWFFFINDKMETEPPFIKSLVPAAPNGKLDLDENIVFNFNKLMMAGTLTTGSTNVSNGQSFVVHKNINIWNLAGKTLGYWVESVNNLNANGEAETTTAFVKHTAFDQAITYRAQAGSALKDIYQNCFKPSDGPNCSGVTGNKPSCCHGVAADALNSEGNCP